MPTFTWKDIIKVRDEIHAVEYPISGEKDNEDCYTCDDFFDAVANEFDINPEDIETYLFDDIDFDPRGLPFGAEACGCYIDGVAE